MQCIQVLQLGAHHSEEEPLVGTGSQVNGSFQKKRASLAGPGMKAAVLESQSRPGRILIRYRASFGSHTILYPYIPVIITVLDSQ